MLQLFWLARGHHSLRDIGVGDYLALHCCRLLALQELHKLFDLSNAEKVIDVVSHFVRRRAGVGRQAHGPGQVGQREVCQNSEDSARNSRVNWDKLPVRCHEALEMCHHLAFPRFGHDEFTEVIDVSGEGRFAFEDCGFDLLPNRDPCHNHSFAHTSDTFATALGPETFSVARSRKRCKRRSK